MNQLQRSRPAYFYESECDLSEFASLTSRTVTLADFEYASDVQKNVPIYDMETLLPSLLDDDSRRSVMAEWAAILLSGPGALALKKAYADTSVIDEATVIYEQIIAEEKAAGGDGADHFAAKGANDRLWNSLQKLCEKDTDVFLRYFANVPIEAVCEAWLGPNFQMTAQVNIVHPGGEAQKAHRDYHLGFQTADVSAKYPAHVHDLSPVLTLQGAVAHTDMPIESGPTKLLPFSQAYRPGYAAWRRDDFRAYFEDHHVQLPLNKGDGLFFNPALFHAAGSNSTEDVHRFANLMQISSAMGRSLEAIDRHSMSKALYPVAAAALKDDTLSREELRAAIACTAEGYPFPTNLDTDPPIGGLAPESPQALFWRALDSDMSAGEFEAELEKQAAKKLP